jgi:hypothetical protein
MVYLEYLVSENIIFFKNFSFFFNNDTVSYKTLNTELVLYIQFSSAVINITLFFLVMLTILNFIYNTFFKNISYLLKLLRFINLFFITIIITLLIIKFYFSLKLEQTLGPYLYDIKYNFFQENNDLFYFEYFIVFSSSFSDAILILSFITGLICLELLGLKNLLKTINNISLFYMFNFFVVLMVSTSNILIMFISFEFIFLPTMYFVYKLGYSKKIDKSNEILFY